MIDRMLNNYKKNEATIEMLKIKINQWKDILTKDIQEIDLIYSKHQDNLGVQKSHNSNPIESMYIRVEEQKKKIKLWIEDSEKKIEKLEQDKKIVNILISSLDEETKFIVVQKHQTRCFFNRSIPSKWRGRTSILFASIPSPS